MLAESLEQPVITSSQLERASADPKRVRLEVKRFKRNPDEYIEKNYKRLVEWDFPTFAAINVNIISKEGRSVTLVFNRVQRRLWQWFLEDLASGQPIRWYIIKARQMGCSTWVLALFYWLTGSRANRNALVVTQDEPSVNNFNSRFRSIHSQANSLLRSPTIVDRRDLVHFGTQTAARQRGEGVGLDSRVVFATAKHGELGRSYNFHAVLLSEFAILPELKIDVHRLLGALNQTIVDLPGTIVIKETTTKGHNEASRMFLDKENGDRKIFISWVAFDEYRRPAKRPLHDLCASDESAGRQTRYGNEVAEARLIEDALRTWYPDEVAAGGQEWIKAEVEARLNWRRYMIDKKCNGDLVTFRREYPTIVQHAFESNSRNVFDLQAIQMMRESVEAEGLRPARFKYIHDPENLNPEDKFISDPYGALIIYEPPIPGGLYVLAADVGMGIPNTGDPSACLVLKVEGDSLEEVASYNQIITPDKFAEMLYYLGLMYGGCLLGVENNERGGYAANLKLHKELRYPNLYYRFDPYDRKAAVAPGFVTKNANKATLVTGVGMRLRDHEILVRTPEAIEQLEHFVDLGNEELGAAPGWYDDFVTVLWIGVHLTTKVHQYNPKPEPPRGSIGWIKKRGGFRKKNYAS
jgi:hypothetical protein